MGERARFASRFVLSVLLLTLAGMQWGPQMAAALLPALRSELAWLDDNYTVQTLEIRQQHGEVVVWLEVSQAHTIVLGDRVFMPDPRGRATASTLIGHLFQAPVLILACALSWPVRSSRVLLQRIVLAAMACGLALALDLPFVLWASIWSLHVDAFQPDRFSPLLVWRDTLSGGGRLALGMGLGLGAAWLSGRTMHTSRT